MFEVFVYAHLCLVTRHGLPDGGPEPTGVDYSREDPVWPRRRLSLDTIHYGDQTSQRRLIGLPFPPAPLDVIKLRHSMGLARPCVPGGSANRGGRELRDGDVIGMAVGAFRAKRNDDVWLPSPEVGGNPCNRLGNFHLIQFAVVVIEEIDFVHA